MSDRYLQFVQETARQIGKEFFLDTGEGNAWGEPGDEWYVEDLSGWLVDQSDAATFKRLLEEGGKKEAWASSYQYCFVLWDLVDQPKPGEPPVIVRFEPA